MTMTELLTIAQRVIGELQRRSVVVPSTPSMTSWPLMGPLAPPAAPPKTSPPVASPVPIVDDDDDDDDDDELTCNLRIGNVCKPKTDEYTSDGKKAYAVLRDHLVRIIGSGPNTRSDNIYVDIKEGAAYAHFASGKRTDAAMALLKHHYADVTYTNKDGRKRVY